MRLHTLSNEHVLSLPSGHSEQQQQIREAMFKYMDKATERVSARTVRTIVSISETKVLISTESVQVSIESKAK